MENLETLSTALKHESPIDRVRLLKLMLKQERLNNKPNDDAAKHKVIKNPQKGEYPYKDRLERKLYEKKSIAFKSNF